MADGSMISRAVTPVPKDDAEFRRWAERTLREQQQDIQALFEMCTDCDRYEKLQRDNAQA